MLSPPTAAGELPRLYELDPLRFQDLCRDLYQAEPEFATADVFGTPGQGQRGVDIIATRRDGSGIGVGQCKRIKPQSFAAVLLEAASDDFLAHLDYWRERRTLKFLLFVASDPSPTQIQEEYLRQRERFRQLGIEYELWGAAVITNKLRSQPGITRSFLGDHWTGILCGTAVTGLQRESVVINSILQAQVETLAAHVAGAAESELECLRVAWRRGKKSEALAGVARLREPGRWQTFPRALRAKVLRLDTLLALDSGDTTRANELAQEAGQLEPGTNARVLALICRAEGQPDRALSLVETATDAESVTLRGALLLELGQVSEALGVLGKVAGDAEAHRLRALAFVVSGDLVKARLEIDKAAELAAEWQVVLFTRAMIGYLGGLSPAVLSRGIPQWPEPQDWSFIKTDDQSRASFRAAGDDIAEVQRVAELKADERRVLETWHLACLANDPERREEATAYCREVLARDQVHYRVLAWALARKLDVDLGKSVEAFKNRIESHEASPPEIIVLLVWHLQSGDLACAKQLLASTRQLFTDAGANDLWQFWSAQVTAVAGEPPSPVDLSLGAAPQNAGAVLAHLHARARSTGNWDVLITELRDRSERGDAQATFEFCSLLASLKRWNQADQAALLLVDRVGTAEALRLACVILYNAKRFADCLRLLDAHRALFPHSELPTEMRRLRVAVQEELGLVPAAIAAGEDLFRREPSKRHFLLLSDLYFEKGDFASLAVLARKHLQFEDFSVIDLLRLSMRLGDEDDSLAAELWRRAAAIGFADAEVTAALDSGYKLGLDHELRPLIQRLGSLPEGHVKSMSLDEVREFLIARRGDMERVYSIYRNGQIPVHLAAEQLRQPLVFWYRRALIENEKAGRSVAGPTLVHHGWRTARSGKLNRQTTPRLHADLTALFTAAHLEILPKIELTFRPILLPHRTVAALAAMRDSVKPVQPIRREWLQAVDELVSCGAIRLIEVSKSEPQAGPETLDLDARTVELLRDARTNGWLFADFLPLRDAGGHPVASLSDEYEAILRSAHCLVDALVALGEVSHERGEMALAALGPEHGRPLKREVAKGIAILCGPGSLEHLAAGGVLDEAARAFQLQVSREDFDAFIAGQLRGFQRAEDDANWISELIDRLNRGIEDDVYRLIPDLEHTDFNGESVAGDSLEVKCLLDLFRFTPTEGDVLWVDDRWMSGFVHRDGVPVIDTFELLSDLSERGVISQSELLGLTHRLREGDVRLLPLGKLEIHERARQAEITDGRIVETRELRTLRRHYARSLVDADMLRVTAPEQGGLLEWPFLLASGAATIDSVAELWQVNESHETVAARAEWLLRNIYVPDRGRAFTKAERTADVDHRLEAIALAAFLSHPMTVPVRDESARRTRREYLEWIYGRLVRRRFDVDPILATATIDLLKALVSSSFDSAVTDMVQRRFAGIVVGALLDDLPEELRERVAQDGDFLAKIGISGQPVIRLGPHHVNPEEFWDAVTTTFKTRRTATLRSDSRELSVKIVESAARTQLVVEDSEAQMQYVVLGEGVGILSNSVAEREAALRDISGSFDLPFAACEDAIARVTTIDDPASRLTELERLRRNSAQHQYEQLERKIREQQAVQHSDLFPDDIGVIIRHLRLSWELPGETPPLAVGLETAAAALVDEVGLEETLVRVSGLPIPLPHVILTRLTSAGADARRQILKRLIPRVGLSPLGAAHLCHLFAHFSDDSSSYARYVRATILRHVVDADSTRSTAWREVLRFCANELSYVEAFRKLPLDLRLAVAWTHGDRLFRILVNSGVDETWIRDHFGDASTKLPTEVTFGDEAYTMDVAHPRRIGGLSFALASAWYASGNGRLLNDSLRNTLSQFVETNPARLISILRDLSLAPDALFSILRQDGRASWLSVFTTSLQEQFSTKTLRSHVTSALDNIRSGQAEVESWAAIHAIVYDHPLPPELASSMREGLLATDLVALYHKNAQAAVLATVSAAQHASRLGADVVDHVRGQLLTFASAIKEMQRRSEEDTDHAQQTLLSGAFYLYGQGDSSEVRGFAEMARLLDELVQRWPSLVDKCQAFVDAVVEGLPNKDSRWFWQLQVKLRALR